MKESLMRAHTGGGNSGWWLERFSGHAAMRADWHQGYFDLQSADDRERLLRLDFISTPFSSVVARHRLMDAAMKMGWG